MTFRILLFTLLNVSVYGQSKIILSEYQQQVPKDKVWLLKSGQQVLCELSFLYTTDNRSLCATALQLTPPMLYGIAEGERPNIKTTKLSLASWKKEPYTNDYTYNIKIASNSELILLPNTIVSLTGCIHSLTVYEYTVTPTELANLKSRKLKQQEEDAKILKEQDRIKERERKMDIGIAKEQRMEYKAAIDDFNKIIETDPKYGFAFYWRGIVYFDLKDTLQACRDFYHSDSLGYEGTKENIKRFCKTKTTTKEEAKTIIVTYVKGVEACGYWHALYFTDNNKKHVDFLNKNNDGKELLEFWNPKLTGKDTTSYVFENYHTVSSSIGKKYKITYTEKMFNYSGCDGDDAYSKNEKTILSYEVIK